MSLLGKQVNKVLEEIKSGKREAFDKLYDLTYIHLKVVARNYLYDPSYIDDVVSEALFRVYRYIDSVDLSCDGYNWICKIVENVAHDTNAQHHDYEPMDKVESFESFYDLEEEIIEKNQLLRLTKKLDKSDQKLLYLRFWQDKTYGEISKIIGQPIMSIYRRIKYLQKILTKFYKK